jgi:XTP/dITP diphosphohydrolase
LEGVPSSLPALIKANRLQDKVRGVGFDWPNKADVWAKVEEEVAEFKEAEAANDAAAMESELGDVLFTWVNYARHAGVDPDLALSRANAKFQARFEAMERLAAEDGKSPSELELADWDAYWNRVKLTNG